MWQCHEKTRRLQGRIRGMPKQLTQIVQLQLTTTTGKIRKMTRVYQKDESIIYLAGICCKSRTKGLIY